MEILKHELEQILAQQANIVAKQSDERMDKRLAAWSKESEERMERYVGGLKEDFDHKLDVVLEYTRDIPAIKEKLDVTFEKVGEMAVDVEIIKEAIKDHERRLQKLEALSA